MKFEELANELLLDLFELLDVIHLFRAFDGLNSRFNTLLFIHFRAYHLDFRSISKHNFNIICQQYLPTIIDRVITLDVSNENETPNLLHLFLSFNFTLNQFNHLQKLSLYHIDSFNTLHVVLIQCLNLPYLTHINLIKCNFQIDQMEILCLITNIWSLSKLTHCSLDNIFLNDILLTDMSATSQSIEYLSIGNIYAPLNIIFYLFQRTPRLRRLRANDIVSYTDEQLHPIVSPLSSLNISFLGEIHSMELLFRNLPNLANLTIRTSGICLNGDKWEKIIINYLPKIKVFRLKMEFTFSGEIDKAKEIDNLLDSFRTHFWIEEHRWFVHYDYNPTNPFNRDTLYTLPYGFKEFVYAKKCFSKSTDPNDNEHEFYDRVRILRYFNKEKELNIYSPRFLNIRHLEINHPLNDHFCSLIVPLNQLKSLFITLSADSVCFQLRALLDRAPCLYSLTLKYCYSNHLELLQVKDSSIRRLIFVQSGSTESDRYFTSAEYAVLSNSPLGIQCEVLAIDVKDRTNIVELINSMTNLRSLTVRCEEDRLDIWQTTSANDEFINWLQKHLPSKSSIIRDTKYMAKIRIWIDS